MGTAPAVSLPPEPAYRPRRLAPTLSEPHHTGTRPGRKLKILPVASGEAEDHGFLRADSSLERRAVL
jgi:hypothetical protein